MAEQSQTTLTSSCHCKAVRLTFPLPKERLNECQCTVCRKYGALWAYYKIADVKIEGEANDKYSWRKKEIAFHRCGHCGCMVYWAPTDLAQPDDEDTMGVNCRMLEKEDVDRFERRYSPGPE